MWWCRQIATLVYDDAGETSDLTYSPYWAYWVSEILDVPTGTPEALAQAVRAVVAECEARESPEAICAREEDQDRRRPSANLKVPGQRLSTGLAKAWTRCAAA